MSYKFTTTSVIEFDEKKDLEIVIAMMPWSPEDKEYFFNSGEYAEVEETDLKGAVEVLHKFKVEEV